jgi:hypothetical protein
VSYSSLFGLKKGGVSSGSRKGMGFSVKLVKEFKSKPIVWRKHPKADENKVVCIFIRDAHYSPLIRRGEYSKQRARQLLYYCLRTRYHGNVLTEPFHCNVNKDK